MKPTWQMDAGELREWLADHYYSHDRSYARFKAFMAVCRRAAAMIGCTAEEVYLVAAEDSRIKRS